MTAQDFTLELFCRVDDAMKGARKHSLAALHPSEVVTIGLLLALRGQGQRAFYSWLKKELHSLFRALPDRTTLFEQLRRQAHWTQQFLAEPTFFGVCDSYGVELLHPKREGRTAGQIGRKGKSNHRWIIGAKLCVVSNSLGQITAWEVDTANVYDATFHPLIEQFKEQMIILSDGGFHAKTGDPENLKVCRKGQWNERMLIETIFSLFTTVLRLKKLSQRVWQALRARVAYTIAAYNLCIAWSGEIKLELAPFAL